MENKTKRFLVAVFFPLALAVGMAFVACVDQRDGDGQNKSTVDAAPTATLPAASQQGQTSSQTQIQDEVTSGRETAITRAVRRISNAVVGINVIQIRELRRRSWLDDDPFFSQFAPIVPYRQRVKSLGSGFILDKAGHVVTNAHVVENASEITITLTDGTQHLADVIGADDISDIALLKIRDPKNLTPVALGNSDDLMIGEWVIALGNPFGLFDLNAKPTVTVGVVSSIDQDFGRVNERVYKDMIQTDAAINRGNSGGPLVNAMGEVIGINSFIYTGGSDGGSIGIGFAIPVNRMKSILDELKRTGTVNRDYWTGIEVDYLTPSVARFLRLANREGAIVTNVQRNSPAARAQLQVGDVIVEVNGKAIRQPEDIKAVIDDLDLRVGDTLKFKVYRDGKLLPVEVELEKYNH